MPAAAAQSGFSAATLQSAATTGAASPYSAQALLQAIFGPIASDPLSALSGGGLSGGGAGNSTFGGGDILGTLFSFINIGLLTLGALYLSYKSLAAITQTAHDGEFIGRAFHTVWVPVRVVTGIFSLTPVFSGWSVLQVIMLWIGVLGAGLGNMAWQGVASTFVPYNTTNVSVAANSSYDSKFTPEVFRMLVCIDAHNAQNQDAQAMGATNFGSQWGSQQINNPDGSITFQYGSSNGVGAECGSVSVPTASNVSTAGGVQLNNGSTFSNFFGSSASQNILSATQAQKNDIQQAALSQYQTLIGALSPLAQTFVTSVNDMLVNPETTTTAPSVNIQQINQVSANYQAGLSQSIGGILNGMNLGGQMSQLMQQSAQQDGFTTAGAWYMTMASMSYAVNSVAQQTGATLLNNPQAAVAADTVYPKAMQIIDTQEQSLGLQPYALGSSYQSQSGSSTASTAWIRIMQTLSSSTGTVGVFFSNPGQTIINWFVTDNSGLPVVLRTKNMADHLIDVAEFVMTAIGSIQGSENNTIFGKIGQLAGGGIITGALTPWFSYLLFVCELTVGFFLMASIYLPMIPFIVYLGQIVAWLLSVIEGVAAAPFLAFAHFDTDGEGLGQRTSFGYTFMLQSFMRPVMLVFGFVVASKMIDVMGGYLMNMYPMVIANAQANSFTGFISILGYCALFMVLIMSLVNSCMSITYILPEALWQFMGAHSSQTTQVGRDTAGSSQNAALGGAAIARSGDKAGFWRSLGKKENGGSNPNAIEKKDDRQGKLDF